MVTARTRIISRFTTEDAEKDRIGADLRDKRYKHYTKDTKVRR